MVAPNVAGIGANVAAASQFFMELVIARNRTPSRGIYCHMTNATDEANVIHVFSAVRDIVLRKVPQSRATDVASALLMGIPTTGHGGHRAPVIYSCRHTMA